MELCEGGSLSSVLPRLGWIERIRVARDVAEGLVHLHTSEVTQLECSQLSNPSDTGNLLGAKLCLRHNRLRLRLDPTALV